MHIYRNSELFRFANRINLEIQAFGKAKISPPWAGQVMTPVFSRLYYINAGSFIITDNDSEAYRLESGKWYLIPAQYSFDYQCHESMEHVYFHIRLYDYDGTDLLRFCKRPLCLTDDSMFDSQLIDRCLRSNLLTDGLLLKQKVFDVVLHFVEKFNIEISAEDYSPCIYRALTYIKQNLSMQLSITEIAQNVFVSKSTLTKHFKKELSMSVNEYICNTIMAEAERLLMTSNISIHDLSLRFGYTDQLYFSRRFKETFGKSPREYRKNKLL